VKLRFEVVPLELRHAWAVSSTAAQGGRRSIDTLLVQLRDDAGREGWGEAPTSLRYHQSAADLTGFLGALPPLKLDFEEVDSSLQFLDGLTGPRSALSALETAFLDGASRHRGVTLARLLELPGPPPSCLTSFSIGIDEPEIIDRKVLEAGDFPILKIKVGSPRDPEILAAVRAAAPNKILRLDANEAWPTKEQALQAMENLAAWGPIELIEQPMPAEASGEDQRWLKQRSPWPIFADESCQTEQDSNRWNDGFHGVNVKLIKTRGPRGARRVLEAARSRGLRTMLGCMMESSCGIAAAFQLASLAHHLDLDSHWLLATDPFAGLEIDRGELRWIHGAPEPGLGIRRRNDPDSRIGNWGHGFHG